MVTDVGFGAGMNVVLEQHSEHKNTYEYVFGYKGNPHSILLPEWMGKPENCSLKASFLRNP